MGSIVIGARAWLIVTCLAAVLATGLGAFFGLRNPPPPEPCRDSYKRYPEAGCTNSCAHADHVMEVGADYMKCICRRKQ